MTTFPQKLTLEKFIFAINSKEKISLSKSAEKNIKKIRAQIEKIIDKNEPIYGINTGFGGLSDKLISKENLFKLQKNLILSHACGVGNPLPQNISRGILFLLINSLSKGYSGIAAETMLGLIKIYNSEIIPHIPEKGSLGASGDLAPLAHLSLILLGKGKSYYKNKLISGAQALKISGIKPLKLKPKEGLALINGTHAMASLLAFNINQAENLSRHADVISALTFEALRGNPDVFNTKIHSLKSHKGQIKTGDNLRQLLKKSSLWKDKDNSQNGRQRQDAYSIRCIPQVHGASKDALNYAKKIIETEINSVTDNPLFINGKFIGAGNFHGQSLAMAADFLSIAVAELADISERRVDRMINPALNNPYPFLTQNSGINSGFMVAQYTAAALTSHNKVLCHPAVTDSIPTSGQQEDHVSMGMTSCLKLREILENTQKVLAIEMLCAAQSLDLQKIKTGAILTNARKIIRKEIPFLENDRELHGDISKANEIIENQEI